MGSIVTPTGLSPLYIGAFVGQHPLFLSGEFNSLQGPIPGIRFAIKLPECVPVLFTTFQADQLVKEHV